MLENGFSLSCRVGAHPQLEDKNFRVFNDQRIVKGNGALHVCNTSSLHSEFPCSNNCFDFIVSRKIWLHSNIILYNHSSSINPGGFSFLEN